MSGELHQHLALLSAALGRLDGQDGRRATNETLLPADALDIAEQCVASLHCALAALEAVAQGWRRRGAPEHGDLHRLELNVMAHGTGLMLTALHYMTTRASLSVTQPLSFPTGTGLVGQDGAPSEDGNGVASCLLRWKGLCAWTLCRLLLFVLPRVGPLYEPLRRKTCVDPDLCDADDQDVSKQVVATARSLTRHLGSDLCLFCFDPSLLSKSLEAFALPAGNVGVLDTTPPLELWSMWVPAALEHILSSSGNGAIPPTVSECGRLAVCMLDALRRWCLDLLEVEEHARDSGAADASGVLPLTVGRVLPRVMTPTTVHVLETLASRLADRIRTGSAGTVLTNIGGLPANVMVGFVTVWSRLSASAATRIAGHEEAVCTKEQAVERVLDMSLDDHAAANGRTHCSANAAVVRRYENSGREVIGELETDGMESVPLTAAVIAERAAHAAFVGDNRRMLSEEEIQRIMTHFSLGCDEGVRELRSRHATLKAHNKNLAGRVVASAVTQRATELLLNMAGDSHNGEELSPIDVSPLESGGGKSLPGSSGGKRPTCAAHPESCSRWAQVLVDRVFDISAVLEGDAPTDGSFATSVVAADALCAAFDAAAERWLLSTTSSNPLCSRPPFRNASAHNSDVDRHRSTSAVEVLSHDDRLAEQEAEVDRLMKEARTLTPRCRAGSRAARLTPINNLGTPRLGTPRHATAQQLQNTFLSPLSDSDTQGVSTCGS
jgi:hypothetical protein